jgi:bacterioferritin-associated ferredoxin
MIVCVCHRVTESQIAGHARSGCSSFEELQDDLRVATGCGACQECALSTFDAAREACAGSCGGLSPRAGSNRMLVAA